MTEKERAKELVRETWCGFLLFYFWCFNCNAPNGKAINNTLQKPFELEYDAQVWAIEQHLKYYPHCPGDNFIISVIPTLFNKSKKKNDS